MLKEIEDLRKRIELEATKLTNTDSIETFRLTHLVRRGTIQQFLDRLREVPNSERPAAGKLLNELRQFARDKHAEAADKFQLVKQDAGPDITMPGKSLGTGHIHPVTQTMDKVVAVFAEMGFAVADGPEIELDEYNFGKLNFAPDHPARDMQDTFFVRSGDDTYAPLLRTHTSSVQIRLMESVKPPIRCIMPGRVYRNEAVSARSLAEFHQIEGLCVDERTSFADLKATITEFARRMYGSAMQFRFRTSYFPFTEPSAEVDISCILCSGKGCRVCKNTGWLEVCGCGMVHANVLRSCGIDPDTYSGYAFGFGIERVTMLLSGIDDIRYLYDNDLRVLRQF